MIKEKGSCYGYPSLFKFYLIDYRPWPLYLLGFWSLGPYDFLALPVTFLPNDTLVFPPDDLALAIR
jgi:hypothetical protein